MSGLNVYGFIPSQPTRSVVNFIKLSEIPYTYHQRNFFIGECDTEEYDQINPNHSVPAIVHDGFNVWESAAIVQYLADAFNVDNQWYPKDLRIRARINSYLFSHDQSTRGRIVHYLRAKVVLPRMLGKPEITEEEEAPFKATATAFLQELESVLSKHRYVARTERASVADIFVHSELVSAMAIPLDLESYPTVKAWFGEISAVPAVAETTAEMREVIGKMLAARQASS